MSQRIIFPRRGQVELQTFDAEPPGPGRIKIKTHYSLMSIGTETTILHQRYDPDSHFARIFSFPQLKTGVQAVGEVAAIGDEVTEFELGQNVFMRMAHGSHQTLPAESCSAVPQGLDLQQACWCGLAKTAFRAAWAAEPLADSSILVIGAGPVGQMLVRWLHARGSTEIAVSDYSDLRLELAKNGGATTVLRGDIQQHLDTMSNAGDSPPLVIDTSGNPKAFVSALAAAAKYGKVILLGDTGYPDQQHLSSDMMTKGLTVQAVHDSHDRGGWTQRKIDEVFFGLVAENKFDLSGLITHRFSPEQCTAAYDLAENDRENVIGILFDWTHLA